MTDRIQDVPNGWESATLGDILEPSRIRIKPAEIARVPYIGLEHIEKNTGKILGFGCSNDIRSLKAQFFVGDLLYGKLRPYLNKVYIAEFDGVCSTDILVFSKNNNISNKYLLYRLLREDFVRYANLNTSGVQHPRVDFKKLANFIVPIAPLPEQHRIVARIEELFSRLDAGVEALRRARAQLQRYRQSVLQAAVEGRLTAEWRAAHPEVEPAEELLRRIETIRQDRKKRSKSIQNFDLPNHPKLPDTWIWVNISQVSDLITDGDHNPPKRTANGIPHLTAKNIKNWMISQEGCTYISEHDFGSVSKRYYPLANDVIITCVGTVGRTAIVPEDCIFSADRNLAAIRLTPNGMNPRFLQYNLNTLASQMAMQSASGSTAQPHLYLGDIRAFPIALAPIKEQQEIINEIEYRFSIIDRLEVQLEVNIKRLDRLRQSILQRAFEGRLVPQDTGDEPASVLLERIRAERIKESPRRGGKSNTNQARQAQ